MSQTFNLKFEGLPNNIIIGSTECNGKEIIIRFIDINNHQWINFKDHSGNDLVGLRNDHNLYWLGPYQILVPYEIKSVVAADGSNSININGSQSELFVKNPISKEEYYQKHTEMVNIGGRLYHVYKAH